MRKITIFLIFILITSIGFGQKKSSSVRNYVPGIPYVSPLYILVVDTSKIMIDSISLNKLNPKWIKTIEVLKDDVSESIYKTKGGVVVLNTKHRYDKKVYKKLKIEK